VNFNDLVNVKVCIMLWMKKWISNPILIILQNDIQKEGPNVEGDGLNG